MLSNAQISVEVGWWLHHSRETGLIFVLLDSVFGKREHHDINVRLGGWLASWNDRCSAPLVLIKDRTDVGLCVVETLQYRPHTPVSLISWLFYYEKWQPCTRSGKMARVACTNPTDLRWTEASRLAVGRWSTVLPGGVNLFLFWRIWVKVDICSPGLAYVVWLGIPNWVLIGSNRHCSSVMETRPSNHSS
jgi:hypothetical protein